MARFGSSDGSGTPGDDPTRSTQYSPRGPQPPGPAPAPFGPAGHNPGDPGYNPGNAPTQYAAYGPVNERQPAAPGTADFAGHPATPWFRRRSVLIAWVGLIAVMLALVIWGIIQLTSRGPSGGSTAPETSSSSTSATTSTSASSTTSTTSSTSTSAGESSTAAPPAAPPRQQPPRQAPVPPDEGPHHHHPHLPSVITIPPIPKVPELPTVITIPPHR